MSYFSKFHSVEFIKTEYRKLCSKYHPDRGGDIEIMKVVNVEYKEALQRVNGQKTYDNKGGEHTYYYNEDVEQALMEKIYELLGLNMSDVEVALIGVWIWITGSNTKTYKESLKALKCRWHSKRKCWYFQNGKKRKRYAKNFSMDDMANKYGYKSFENDGFVAIN